MAELSLGQGFEAVGAVRASLAFSLVLTGQGFGKKFFFEVLRIFLFSGYSGGGCRNRTLKTKYVRGLQLRPLQFSLIPIRD